MHPSHWASATPEAPSIIMAGSGETVTYRELEDAANRNAQLLRHLGLRTGDTFALWSANSARYMELAWAMQRSGLYMVPIAAKLNEEEAAYIINDSGASLVIIDQSLKHAADLADRLGELCPDVEHAFSLHGPLFGMAQWETMAMKMPATLIDDPASGMPLMYSSGTTGKPKGIKKVPPNKAHDETHPFAPLMNKIYGCDVGTRFILSAPLYHSGPLAMAMAAHCLGTTVLLFEKFDAQAMLQAIDQYRPEHGQFVPTMFVRLLKLPEEVRGRYDVSSLKTVIHSAAPCPPDVKRRMIEWWGPVLQEIYGGTENIGSTMISSEEWLRKPGSVGRPMVGSLHICDESGDELPPGQAGMVYFNTGESFEYLNDPKKTRETQNPKNASWRTFGDIGYVDDEGYLFLTDRKAFMIISGGVNIYPQEAENVLLMHPAVHDAVVFGIPEPDLGEQVKAVIEPVDWSRAGPEFEQELIAYCKSRLATLKCPRSVDFERHLPRDDAGKLAKKALRDRYW